MKKSYVKKVAGAVTGMFIVICNSGIGGYDERK